MRSRAILVSIAAGMATACATQAREARSLDDALEQLRAGGNIIVMRHATSPSGQAAPVGMTAGCVLAPGRGLSAQGFFEARFIGALLAENGVKIDKTYTSDLCRSYDTARLVAAGAGAVIPRAEMKSDDPAVADAFKKRLAADLAAAPTANILLVNHSNVAPLYGAGPLPGEDETPSGRIHVVKNGETIRIDVNAAVVAAPTLPQ